MQLIRTWHIEDSKLLVYEYMENQSLDRWLHGNKRSPISGMNSVHHAVLDWPRSNILLDSEFDAKIADFGLAKMLTRHASAHSMSIVAGSSGYLAPINLNGFKLGGNREIVGLRTKKQQLTCNREMRQTGMKKPQFTFVMKILFILTSREKKLPTREL
ncbi:hypothetical protein V6N12_063397 [Hibiscus sabdariffa]|uniref:Protein kinase domain-containing protein n=1 Tax=Hibiscus sabdariffa TaxID=183260 RepID=A0ABR2FBK9_9ROSI